MSLDSFVHKAEQKRAQEQANQASKIETKHNNSQPVITSNAEQYSPVNNNMYAPPVNCSTQQPSPLAIQEQNNQTPALQYASHDQPIDHFHYKENHLYSMKSANDAYKTIKEHIKIRDEQQLMTTVREAMAHLNSRAPSYFQCAPTVHPQHFNLNHPKLKELSSSLASEHHDDLGVLLLCLGAFGAATCGRVDIQIEGGWIEKTPSMQLHACAPGTMKSSVVNKLRKPFDDFQAKLENLMPDEETRKADERVKAATKKKNDKELIRLMEGKEFTPELLDELRNTAKTYITKTRVLTATIEKTPPMLLVDKTTPSGLVKILHAQGEVCACISAEGDFVDSMLLKTNSEPIFFNKLFNQEPFAGTINRKNIQLKQPAFSMLCFVQHDVLRKFFDNDKLQSLGTTARILPYLHSGIKFFPQDYAPNSNVYDWYYQKIMDMFNLYYTQDSSAKRYKVTLTHEAINKVRAYKQELDNSVLRHAKAIPAKSKLCGQAVRIAWNIHACNYDIPHEQPITVNEVTLAIELCRIFHAHVSYVYDSSGLQAYDNAIKIIANLQNININLGNDKLSQGYIDSRDLQQRTHIKAKYMLDALYLLQRHNWVRIIDNGKRSYMVIPHPRIRHY